MLYEHAHPLLHRQGKGDAVSTFVICMTDKGASNTRYIYIYILISEPHRNEKLISNITQPLCLQTGYC